MALNLACTQKKLYKTLPYRSRDMLNFDFLKKSLGTVSSPYFLYDFSRKLFLMFYSINCLSPSSDWLYFLRCNMSNAIVFLSSCDVISFETNLYFLIKPFFYMTKIPRQKFKNLENKKSF